MVVRIEGEQSEEEAEIDLDLSHPYEQTLVQAWTYGHSQLRTTGMGFLSLDFNALEVLFGWMQVRQEWRWLLVKDLVEVSHTFVQHLNKPR